MKARSREGPLPPRGGEGLGRRRLGPGGECRARASGFPVPRPSSQVARSRPCRCTVRPLLGPLGGNRLPAQVGSLEALNVAFQKFFKLPRPAQHSRVALFPRSLHPRYSCSTGCAGWGKGAGRRRLRGRSPTSGARLGLERLEIRSLCRPRRKRRHAAPAPHQPEGEGVGGEGRARGQPRRGARSPLRDGWAQRRFRRNQPAKALRRAAQGHLPEQVPDLRLSRAPPPSRPGVSLSWPLAPRPAPGRGAESSRDPSAPDCGGRSAHCACAGLQAPSESRAFRVRNACQVKPTAPSLSSYPAAASRRQRAPFQCASVGTRVALLELRTESCRAAPSPARPLLGGKPDWG
uniref:Uncharacterized protein n=1 Tax=Rangifer tarandus platyrhynchus TaxID=3082113 RepID=A0ACB0DQZ6_RANTA|nr:unnamed protein product [Rangifer tarandus platyrhynchus]